jgi:hypothetical protein
MSVKKGYYKTHLNREKALKEYLEKYKTLKNISYNAEGKRLYDIFYKYKDDIYSTAINLGYNMEDIVGNLPNNYYNNFNIIKGKIENFILENNRFPTAKEMEKQLKINLSYMYKKYGNIYNIKELMKYDDSKDLVDLRGDINRSFGELFVANFLILNGLKDKYDREQYPFPKNEGLYRSDFTFYMDKEEIHIEIWGVKECQHDIRAIEYKKTKEIKKQLYNKYNDKIRLVEIDYDIFSKSYLEIEQHLIDKLQFIFNEELKVVDYDILIKSCKMSDQQLFDEIISLSDNSNQLPPTHKFEGSLYNEVLKRFKTLNNFALYFNVKTHTENMNWNKELIFDYFRSFSSFYLTTVKKDFYFKATISYLF